jgi:PIN domain nuclease of toxin-antitoxin system
VHHKDPDDSMIVSLAIAEQIPLVTADSAFGSYAMTKLW